MFYFAGMAAINAVAEALLEVGDHVVASKQVKNAFLKSFRVPSFPIPVPRQTGKADPPRISIPKSRS